MQNQLGSRKTEPTCTRRRRAVPGNPVASEDPIMRNQLGPSKAEPTCLRHRGMVRGNAVALEDSIV